jgi:glycosyltransferase involved in cell wall biosynthesis
MRIIVAHNYYRQPGGEDEVFASEAALLRSHGHDVEAFVMRNDDIELMGKLATLRATLWNGQSHERLRKLIRHARAQVVHFHNTFPLMSPSVYYAARAEGAAVVQTLHNYRLLCPGGTLFRDGKTCEQCVGAVPWRAVQHACYRSRATTCVSTMMLTTHRAVGTYSNAVDAYIALSDFARKKFIEGGLPADKLHLKSNFVDPDPMPGKGEDAYALFVGRLTDEKGIHALLEAWRANAQGDHALGLPLKIVGDGPLRPEVEAAVRQNAQIECLGRRPLAKVCDLIGNAQMLIFPSLWYEGMPRVIVESFAKGTPVVASNLGTMAEMIRDGENGWLFAPGDSFQLAATVRRALAADHAKLRRGARHEYESKYTSARNYEALMQIYSIARERAGNRPDDDSAACGLANPTAQAS